MATTELSLSITPQDDGNWLILCSGAVPRHALIKPPLSADDINNLRRVVKDGARRVKVDDAAFRSSGVVQDDWTKHLESIGKRLFDALMQGKLRAAYRDAIVGVREGALRIRVCSDHPDVVSYPWELLCDPDGTIFLSRRHGYALVRSGETIREEAPPSIDKPLRILIVAASPTGYAPISWENEERLIRECMHVTGECEVNTISGPNTWSQLQAEMRGAHSPHVIHFIGHGDFDAGSTDGALVFQDKSSAPVLYRASDLADLIGNRISLRLVVLNSCQGTVATVQRRMAAVASSIFGLGIPAVVAMQNDVRDDTAQAFARLLYSGIAVGEPLDEVLAGARRELLVATNPPTPEWITPVLFLGTKDANVFGLTVTAEQMVQRIVRSLEERHWGTAKRMSEMLASRWRAGHGARADDFQRLAANLEEYDKAASRAEARLSSNADSRKALDDWANAVLGIDVSLLSSTLAPSNTVLAEIEQARRIATQLREGRYDPALRLLDDAIKLQSAGDARTDGTATRSQIGNVGVRVLPLLRSFIAKCKESHQQLEDAEIEWQHGRWENTLNFVLPALNTSADGATLSRWEQRVHVLRAVCAAVKPLKDTALGNLESLEHAHRVLASQSGPEALPGLDIALTVVSFATQLLRADASLTDERVSQIDREWNAIGTKAQTTFPWAAPIPDLLRTVRKRVALFNARAAFAAGKYQEAADHFDACDEPERASHSRRWQTVLELLAQHNWSEARDLLQVIQRNQTTLSDLEVSDLRLWINWCGRAGGVIGPVERMAACRWIPEPRVSGPDGASPYRVLAQMKLLPNLKLKDAADLSLDAMEIDMDAATSNTNFVAATNAMRLLDQRLAADFAVYEIANPERVAYVLERLTQIKPAVAPGLDMVDLRRELGADMGIFFALRGRNFDDAAIETLALAARDRPDLPARLHHLGLAAAAKIETVQAAMDNDSQIDADALDKAWEHLIEGWGALFGDENEFWHHWWRRRRELLDEPISLGQVQNARQRLQHHWTNRIKDSRWDLDLEIKLLAEIRGARVLNNLGGLPLETAGRRAVLGLRAVRAFGLQETLAQWTRALSDKNELQDDVLLYFSQLSRPAALKYEGRFREAGELLAKLADADARNVDVNPAFAHLTDPLDLFSHHRCALLLECRRKQAIDAVSALPLRVMETLGSWTESLHLAKQRGAAMQAEVRKEIIDFCVGRAHQLEQRSESDTYEAALDSAIELLEAVLKKEWDDDRNSIQQAYMDRLLDKAQYVSTKHDDDKRAREIARRAYRLAPNNLRCIETLAMTTLYRSQELWHTGEEEASNACINEVENVLLPQGQDLFGATPNLEHIGKYIVNLRQDHSVGIKGQLTNAISAISTDSQLGTQNGGLRALMVEATVAESEKRFRVATNLYAQVLQVTPEDRHVQGKLANCYNSWLQYHREIGDVGVPHELNCSQIASEARQRCPTSSLFDNS